jgi:hypothetical protein
MGPVGLASCLPALFPEALPPIYAIRLGLRNPARTKDLDSSRRPLPSPPIVPIDSILIAPDSGALRPLDGDRAVPTASILAIAIGRIIPN